MINKCEMCNEPISKVGRLNWVEVRDNRLKICKYCRNNIKSPDELIEDNISAISSLFYLIDKNKKEIRKIQKKLQMEIM